MRRPPGLWILLSAGVVWLSLQDVYGLRATSLIFGKTTTTTTTTEEPEALEEETVTTELNGDPDATKPNLTGNPQLDYIWDPNLPKELNGFNLSDYPFYERVPEDIDFKCDGLHDGFYASVKHKCQVYHHCLFGTRYDFLCANYTAFDQTLFNCNFVSNVDCANSKNFWHRNDELYKAESTTTPAPVAYNFYTPAPQGLPLTASPGQLPPAPINNRRPVAPSRSRPHARVRPAQIDYYEDEYEEIPRPKTRKRRPRPRPVYYDDDYEEYEDRPAIRRGGGRRPVPRRERPLRRNKDRRNYEDDAADYRYEDDLTLGTKQKEKRRKPVDDYEYEDDTRDVIEKRRPQNRRDDKPARKSNKRPVEDDYEEEDEKYERRKIREESRKPPRLGKRRPPSEDYEDDLQQADDPRPRKSNRDGTYKKPAEEGRPIIKPVSGTIYDRPRVAPKINLPVPKNAADKFAYKSVAAQPSAAELDEEYEDYEEPLPKRSENTRKGAGSSRVQTSSREDYSEAPLRSNTRPKVEVIRERDLSRASSNRKRPAVTEYDDYEDDVPKKIVKPTSTTSTTESIVDHPMPVVRKFKRPFLPSRGGSPYSARSLQPVGVKALNRTESQKIISEEAGNGRPRSRLDHADLSVNSNEEIEEDIKSIPARVKSPLPLETIDSSSEVDSSLESSAKENSEEVKSEIKPGPVRIKVPIRVKSSYTDLENPSPQNQNRQNYKTTTQSKLIDPDILNENYDVALNEAISPIIPSIPVRSFGGFNTASDYSYKRFQRPTKYVILDPVVSAGSAYYVK